jgi:hypothetical protein
MAIKLCFSGNKFSRLAMVSSRIIISADQKLCLEPSSDNRKSADAIPSSGGDSKKESPPLHPGSLRTGLLPTGGELQK